MCPSRLLAAALLVAAGLPPASAADLDKIDRTLTDEPKYVTATPRYCLLAFGPEAKTHVWLVHDGDVLHVHASPDGKAAPVWRQVGRNQSGYFALGDILEEGGPGRYTNLRYVPGSRTGKLSVSVGGKRQFAGWDRNGILVFASSAKEAPVVHFAGPLTLDLHRTQEPLGSDGTDITAVVGTYGIGPGTFALFGCGSYPPGAWPTAVIEFPARDGGKPIVAKVRLAEE
jgi:hypothetical protein